MNGIRLDFDLRQFGILAQGWAKAPEMTRREMVAAATEASLLVEREAKEKAPVAHGTFRASIRSQRPRVMGQRILGMVSSPLPYAEPVEMGTAPHRPPIEPLVAWAKVKLGLSEDDAKSAAWGIAKKIEREGTDGQFPLSRALTDNAGQVEAIFNRALDRIGAGLATVGVH